MKGGGFHATTSLAEADCSLSVRAILGAFEIAREFLGAVGTVKRKHRSTQKKSPNGASS